jgi:hypothetical protein
MLLPASEVITVFCCLLTLTSQIDSFSALELLPGSTRHSFDTYNRNTNDFCIEDDELHNNRERHSEEEESKDEPSSPLVTLHRGDQALAHSSVSLSASDSASSRSRSSSSSGDIKGPQVANQGDSVSADDFKQSPSNRSIIVNDSIHL